MKVRCPWPGNDPDYIAYHDLEWGLPCHDDRRLFEFLILEGAQAGLAWITILRKRANYHKAFDAFDPEKIARYDETRMEALAQDAGIIRNRLKIKSAVQNARAFLKVQEAFGSFDSYIWNFVDGRPIKNAWKTMDEVPAQTPLAQTISKDLKKRGFNFVGPTICYAYMQSMGMVNDHLVDCFRYSEV
ncbi:DNA-3-methyladenine glycosylase I [Desulfatibacillum alkenivorans DSM 16219]|jgi:DNA-3-methyladenine glycosylase I|uniref:DNA-3-methyladenine glycosylase I n=1 Tax=Desulfatibacillum alkenivorans DSM 16219 TaxID=1121393 RepID=A0A1M6Q2Z5_9BACT|nr:DNA-3-methyladenine glycosylase I [Desulfatibacillum alkenivorans]SHK14615.1 DNA-3-methyladenine glycosylase I [Desulfatibacillum alkenivorans DSM 16219]